MVPIHVLYGTETYNSEGLAERTGEAIEALGLEVVVLDMDDFDPGLLPHLHTLIIVTSTFGAGEPPSNAEALYEHLFDEEAPALDGLRFSVCALGDSSYEDFCQCGKDFDARLGELGGVRVVPRVDCDVDFEPPWQGWLDQLAEVLPQLDYPDEDLDFSAISAAMPAREAAAPRLGTRKNPFLATVLYNENLNAPGSEKETRHVILSLAGSGIEYKVGDSLGLFPRNCPDLVRRILTAMQMDRDAVVMVDDEPKTIRYALMHHRDLTTIEKRLLELALHGPEWQRFAPLLDDADARKRYIEAHHVIDFLHHARIKPEPQAFFDALRPLAPRLYSISSSPYMHPGEVHLTVDVLRYEMHGLLRKGVSSTFLGERAGPEVQVPVYLRPTNDFVLCEDTTPIIMIGPGTGIAPFRAFLEDRAARGVTNSYAWLFFGARHEATDFLYRDELYGYLHNGVLTRLDTAFSRDQGGKVYVQDRLWQHAADVFAWLQAGAAIYICGDASRMAKDVHGMFARILTAHGGYTPEESEAVLQQLAASGRYLRDVY